MYRIDTRDQRERWHSPRGLRFESFMAAMNALPSLGVTAVRIVNVETGTVEYEELVS